MSSKLNTFNTSINPCPVEQPVGTGFSTGKPTATNEVDVANQFLGFFKNFETLFNITNYKIYVTVSWRPPSIGTIMPLLTVDRASRTRADMFRTFRQPCSTRTTQPTLILPVGLLKYLGDFVHSQSRRCARV